MNDEVNRQYVKAISETSHQSRMIPRGWNIEHDSNTGSLHVCRGDHERHEGCTWEEFVPKRDLTIAIERAEKAENTVDLMRDEFQRIAARCVESGGVMSAFLVEEVQHLCQRAISDIEQRVPVVVQRDQAQRKADQWRDVATRMAYELREWSSATPLVSATTTGALLNEFDAMIAKEKAGNNE